MPGLDLSPNERVVFHSLVKYPNLNDRELSERVQVKLSTVTAIKNRLKARGLFYTVRFPQLQHLGCEMLTANWAALNSSTPPEKRLEVGRSLLTDFPEIFYLASDERLGFALSLNKNYSAAKSNTERFFRLYSENEVLLSEGYEAAHFPFAQSRVYNTFECAHLLASDFQIPEKDDKRVARDAAAGPAFETVRNVELSRIERRVYRGLIANPDFHDSSVAKQIDVTRQTVTKVRKRFEALGLIRLLRIPNLAGMGYEVMAVLRQHYRPSQPLETRREKEEPFFARSPIIFRVAGDLEAVEVFAFHNFAEYQKGLVSISKFNRENRFVAREPDVMSFSMHQMYTIKNHVYAGTVDRLLEGEIV